MMDLTPLEVRKKKGDFRRQIRGYDPESVDDFLDLVADRLETLVRENAALTESSSGLEQRVSDYREREKALTEALVSAQQLREEMRVKAVREAEAARSQAEKDADEHRSAAAQDAEQARREASDVLARAQSEAAEMVESARHAAQLEAESIRAELERVRELETETIRILQMRRAELLHSYRSLLQTEITQLETLRAAAESGKGLPATVVATDSAIAPQASAPAVPGTVTSPDEAEAALPPLSADLAALIEAAESDVERSWADEDIADEPAVEEPGAADLASVTGGEAVSAEVLEADQAEAAADLLLDEGDDDAWLSGLVADEAEAAAAPAVGAWERPAESDEDFIDNLIAEAGVVPVMGGNPPVEPPSFLDEPEALAGAELEAVDLEEDALLLEEVEEAAFEDEATETAVAEILAEAGDGAGEGEPSAEIETPVAEAESASDPLAILDEDEGFDALFDDTDENGADFDFDAALANATGFPGGGQSRNDAENPFDLGIELDDPASPLDLGRGGAGAFSLDDLRRPPVRGGFAQRRPTDLTLRPLSPEEEAPDLPVESRQRDETDDDMFTTMFRGR